MCGAVVDVRVVGFYSLVGGGAVLDPLWVLPGWMGQGIGRTLFEHAVRRAGALGVAVVGIEADPNATGFYRRMGARRVGENASELDGRERILPLLEIDVKRLAL